MLNHPEFANPVLTEEESRKELAPYFEKFLTVINKAFAAWRANPDRHRLNNRARASFINSIMVYLAKEMFAPDHPYVDFKEKGGSFFLFIGNQINMRVKKFKANGTYSNLMTGRQLQLIQQKNLEGMRPGTFLTVGYQLTKLQDEIQARKVTLQSKNRIVYEIDLDEAVAGAATQVPIVPVIPSQPPSLTTVRRVKAKKHAKAKGKEAKAN